MKFLGACTRWFLNINTIWALMILVAFAFTVVQHYAPTKTITDLGAWKQGTNFLEIKAVGKDDKIYQKRFTLPHGEQGVVIPAEYREVAREDRKSEPFLLAIREEKGKVAVVWDLKQHGKYTVTLNDTKIESGSLVTLQTLTDAALSYAKTAFDIALGLVAVFVLFLGLMKVGEEAGIVQLAARVIRPVIRFLFPDVPADHPANGAILMNITTSMLGLGNAATPFGLKAMEELQKLNRSKIIASDSQVMLMAWNTAGFAFLPTSMIAVRQAAGATRPLEILGTCMFAGTVATLVGVIAVKSLGALPFFRYEAALAEAGETADAAAESSESPDGKKSQ